MPVKLRCTHCPSLCQAAKIILDFFFFVKMITKKDFKGDFEILVIGVERILNLSTSTLLGRRSLYPSYGQSPTTPLFPLRFFRSLPTFCPFWACGFPVLC